MVATFLYGLYENFCRSFILDNEVQESFSPFKHFNIV